MQSKITFSKSSKLLIGAVHLPPLLGYSDFPGFDVAVKNMLADLQAFERGGADAIIFENNYDIPHKASVDASVVASMTYLGEELKRATGLPVGISVLWNDYRTALSIAKTLGLQFIRVPVFVDTVQTSYGIMEGNAEDVVAFRSSIRAEEVGLFVDIHVKHAALVSKHTLLESADLAKQKGADAIILTGKWTGDAPNISEVSSIRDHVGDFPILLGSGVDAQNAPILFKYANGAIVSTSLKQGVGDAAHVNVKSYDQRVDVGKVKELRRSIDS